jgi:phosphatidyl-myo-inositol dimannoside synthase
MILTIQSTTFGTYGGISTYNRLVCRALSDFDQNVGKRVLLASDTPADFEDHSAELSGLAVEAFSRDRLAFLKRTLMLGATKQIKLLLLGHVNYAPIGRLLRTFQPRLKYGVFVYGIDVWDTLPILKRTALRQADFIVSISDYTKRVCAEVNRVAPERFCLLPNAVVDVKSLPAIGGYPTSEAIRLLTVCRVDASERYKGVDTVISSLPLVLSAVRRIEYHIVGSGSDLDRLKTLARDLGVTDHVHFLGWVTDAQLQEEYERCDMFVMPSAREGFGFVFIEAMQCGKPVIAADAGGAPEVVEDGITGILVPYGEVAKLAEAITRLSCDLGLRARLGEAGYRRVKDQFTFPRFRDTLTEILQTHLGSSN